jgi:hypothetical protein
MDGEKGQRKVERMKIHIPHSNTRFLPQISPIFPAGTRNTAEDSRYEVATQLRRTAPAPNAFWIAGSAIFTADNMNGGRKDVRAATARTIFLEVPDDDFWTFSMNNTRFTYDL